MKIFINLFAALILIIACNQDKKEKIEALNINGVHKVIVQEILNVTDYTYLRVLENNNELWLAVPHSETEVGKTIYYKNGMKMPNFKSKALNKTFEAIYFIERISTSPNFNIDTLPVMPTSVTRNLTKNSIKPELKRVSVKLKKDKGSITIAELYKNKNKYENKTVKIKGKVTKFNPAIMDKNWIHIQDGTEFNNNFDLTATINIDVKVGDVVTIKGKVSLNKNFGAGYVYSIILDNATLTKKP